MTLVAALARAPAGHGRADAGGQPDAGPNTPQTRWGRTVEAVRS
jgi:hypothetical protein